MALVDHNANVEGAYHLDEASGNATDSSGNSYTLVQTGTVTSETGKLGTSRGFGSGDKLVIADNADFSGGDVDFSLSCWIYFDDLGDVHRFAGKFADTSDPALCEYGLAWFLAQGRFYWFVSNGSAITYLEATTFGAASINTWYHVVGVHDAVNNQIRIYVNGVKDTFSYSAGVVNQTNDFGISPSGATGVTRGRVDELLFYKGYALVDADVAELYAGGAGFAFPFSGGNPAVVAGTASFVSSGPAGIIVTTTAPSGGTGAIGTQWQRSTTGGGSGFSNLSNGGGVSGATTLTLTDDSGSLGTLYYYRAVFTDTVSETATTNEVSAEPYEGGEITGAGGTGNLIRVGGYL